MDSPSQDSAQAVQRKQQLDAERLLQRLEELPVADVTGNDTLEQSSVIIPAVLIRFLVLAVLFRLNSAKKWHATLDKQLLPESLRNWLGIERLADLARQAKSGKTQTLRKSGKTQTLRRRDGKAGTS